MTDDIHIRITGRAGRITLNRPQALNALTYDMGLAIEAAIDAWANDDRVALVVIDAIGERAFCSGGDIAKIYDTAKAGDFAFARRFWADEYRLNAKIFNFPKPYVAFMQGFTMGGGVGISCHGSHRVVGETSQIAMPECNIGLIPDAGGSLLLARAPGRLGEYLGTTGTRMGPADAIHTGFADYYIPQTDWPQVIAALEATGNPSVIDAAAGEAPDSTLAAQQADIDDHFGGETLGDIQRALLHSDTDFTRGAIKALSRQSPLSATCAVELIHRVRNSDTIEAALGQEYRFTFRAPEHGDFVEGIRAAIIDKDRTPSWKYPSIDKVTPDRISAMLLPLGVHALKLTEDAMKIGFIGLGNMGAPMAANLVAAGHQVTGFDTAAPCPKGLAKASSAAEAARGQDVVITMLPNGTILRSVASEIIPAMTKGAVFLDCSTVDVDSARAVADLAQEADLLAVDAPVSGGTGGATAGTLTFMAGGSDAAFAKVKPLFDVMGQKAVHCGPSGNGQAAKICNNMILGVTMIATCEAFALADKLGLDRQKMFDVVSTSSGYSWTMNAYCPAPGVGPKSPADNDYKPGFAADLMLKDLRLSQQAAAAVDADTPMGQAAAALYEQFVEHEDGAGRDFSAMLPRFEKRHRG